MVHTEVAHRVGEGRAREQGCDWCRDQQRDRQASFSHLSGLRDEVAKWMMGMLPKLLLALLFVFAAPQFRLRDTAGVEHTIRDWSGAKAVVVFFVIIDCPIGNSYVPEMNRIRETYAPRGVVTWAVQADPSVPQPAVVKYAADFRYTFPLLLDPDQVLVRHTGATIT